MARWTEEVSPDVFPDAAGGTRLDGHVGDRPFHEEARSLAVGAVARQIDDRRHAGPVRDGVNRGFDVKRPAGKECAGRCRRVRGRDARREAAVLPPIGHGEVVRPEDVDAHVSDRATVAGPHDLGTHPMGVEARGKCGPRAVAVGEVVEDDRGNHQAIDGKGTQHLRKRGHPRARPVGEQDGVDPPDAQRGQCRHDAPGARVAVGHASGIEEHRRVAARDHVARSFPDIERRHHERSGSTVEPVRTCGSEPEQPGEHCGDRPRDPSQRGGSRSPCKHRRHERCNRPPCRRPARPPDGPGQVERRDRHLVERPGAGRRRHAEGRVRRARDR